MDIGTKKRADLGTREERSKVVRHWLGPQVVTTRIRPPKAALALAREKKTAGVQVKVVPVSECIDSAKKQGSPPSSSLDSKG